LSINLPKIAKAALDELKGNNEALKDKEKPENF
jgi:hypothetical protein